MADEMHPVVELLLARMKSHPEDFVFKREPYPMDSRVSVMVGLYNDAISYASETEAALLKAASNKVHLDHVHHCVMEELLNGDERRAEREKSEQDAKMYATQLARQKYAQQGQGQLGGVGSTALLGSPYGAAQQSLQDYQNAMTLGSTGITSVNTGALQIDGETLDAGMIKNIKKKLLGI